VTVGVSCLLDPLVGTIVDGKYQVIERIGRGGMGTVYSAVHVSLGAPRALKVMRPELAADPELAARFRDEARLAEGLRHPSLVALYDFGQMPGRGWYIVSELVRGATVAALLQRRGTRFCSDDVARLVGQIADGLALAHRRGVIHRDISPDNVMLTSSPEGEVAAKLLDFGIAKDTLDPFAGGFTGARWNMGKVGYSSPEQMGLLSEGAAIDARSDVFSLAAVAYVMLTGRLPWRIDAPQAYTHDLLLRPVEHLGAEVRRHAPPAWGELFVAALARERTERVPDAPTLRRRLAEAAHAAREGGEAEPPPFRADQLRSGAREGDETDAAALASPIASGDLEPRPQGTGSPRTVAAGPLLVPSAALDADMAAAEGLAPEAESPRPAVAREPGRVVFLEDDEALRNVLPDLLARLGFDAIALSWDCADTLSERRPALVLADPGDEATRAHRRMAALRGVPGLAGTPVVLFSALDPWSLRERARALDLPRYVSKEGLAGDVAAMVRRLLEGRPLPAES